MIATLEQPCWPEGRRFAFTVFDDTDEATLAAVVPVYELLADLGLLTTKSVWPVAGPGEAVLGGATCEDRAYRDWLIRLQASGFEIGLHNATYHSSTRRETIAAIERFERIFGRPPATLANHTSNAEGIYWGPNRLSGTRRAVYHLLTRFRHRGRFRGHSPGDPLFWGDICRQKIKYVRNFVYGQINTLAACPWMPYHDPARPYVNYWFASSEGADVDTFCRMLSEANQDRLESEEGACIMYTHFAAGFVERGRLNRRFCTLMERLAARPGWFVPVETLLDRLRAAPGAGRLSAANRRRLERRWLMHKAMVGTC